MTEHNPTEPVTPHDDDNLDAPPGTFAADAAERDARGETLETVERPLTANDIAQPDDDAKPEHDPALVGTIALENLLTTDPTVTLGDDDHRQTVRLRFDMLALAELEKRYGSVMAPMQGLSEAAVALESGEASTVDRPLIGTVLEVATIAAQRQRITVPEELRAGSAGAPVMPSRVRVKDYPDVFLELLADGPETFADLLLKVVAAFAASFGSTGGAEGNVPTGSTGSPGGTGGTSPSATFTSDPASFGA